MPIPSREETKMAAVAVKTTTALTAKEIMTGPVITVREDTRLEEIARLLSCHGISGVPVVDDEDRVIGIVSESDLIDEHRREVRIPRVALFGLFPIPDDMIVEAARRGMTLPASALMSRRVITATEHATVHELADLMTTHRINRIPIESSGRLVGIVCRADIVRALAWDEPCEV
jgi:CBS domain-containing protein